MKYDGTFICGHEGTVSITGNSKDREWKVNRAFNRLCEDCYKEEKQREFNEIQKISEEYITLEGTTKQVEWANEIRYHFLEQLSDTSPEELVKYARVALISVGEEKILNTTIEEMKHNLANRITNAETFIDARREFFLKFLLRNIEILCMKEEKYEEDLQNVETIEKEKEELYLLETEDTVKDGIVIISNDENRINISYQYDRDFIDIVKAYQYYWDRPYWTRKSKDIVNNMAEIATRLLSDGFRVQLEDLTAVDLVKNNSYIRENFNKILFSNGSFKISWNGFDNDLYFEAKSIPTARWSSVQDKMIIDKNAVNEVLEFARINKFEFTETAKEALEELRVNSIIVSVTGDPITRTGLEEILNSSTDILDDLKDD